MYNPYRRGERLCVQSPPEGEKLCVISLRIYPSKLGETKAVPSGVGKTRVSLVDYNAHKRRIQVSLQGTPKSIGTKSVTQASTRKMPYGPLFKICCRKAPSKLFILHRVWVFTAVSSWFQNQATTGGQS